MNRDWHDMSLNELAAAIFDKLSGDGDGHGEGTRAEVDHAIPSHPVIRIHTNNRDNGGGGGGGGGESRLPGCYEIVSQDSESSGGESTASRRFANRYYEVAGVIREGPDGSPDDYKGRALGIRVYSVLSSGSAAPPVLAGYGSVSEMAQDMSNSNYVVIPLYKFTSDGEVECDLRHLPRADMWNSLNVVNANAGNS